MPLAMVALTCKSCLAPVVSAEDLDPPALLALLVATDATESTALRDRRDRKALKVSLVNS